MKKSLALGIALATGSLMASGAAAATVEGEGVSPPSIAAQLPAAAAVTAAASSEAAGMSASSTEAAAASESAPSDDRWEFSMTSYVWMSGINGDVNIPGPSNDVDFHQSFFDLLGDLSFAYMGSLNLRKGRFVGMTDTMFFHLKTDADGPAGFTDADVSTKMTISTLLAGYRVVDNGPMFLDLMVGGRYGKLKVDIDLDGPLASREDEASKSNFSPTIAARFNAPLGGKWGMLLYADASSLVSKSVVKYQLLSTINYTFNEKWRVGAGYRYMKFGAEKDNVEIDMGMHGPIIAVTHSF